MKKIIKHIIGFVMTLAIILSLMVSLSFNSKETFAETIYSWGSRGDVVREIQTRLQDWGYPIDYVDGIFGLNTYEAVVEFQRNNGITPDGIVGSRTLELMGINPSQGQSESVDITDYDEDLRILAAAIHGEGRGEPYEGQVAIGAVILNRVDSPNFPNSIAEVVYQRGAFDAVRDGQITLEPNETAYRAAQDALNGWDPTNGALYYWNPATATSKWIWSVPITTQIGRHVFGTK